MSEQVKDSFDLEPGDLAVYYTTMGGWIQDWSAWDACTFGQAHGILFMEDRPFKVHSTALVLSVRLECGVMQTLFLCEGRLGVLFGKYLRRAG